jgi:hypothetical protein
VDLCVGTDQAIEADGQQIKAGEIPGGRCAVLRVVGNTDNLESAALYLYRDWLPASGEEARDFPIYCQRLSFFPEVPEHEAVVELFLPLKLRPLTAACPFRSPEADRPLSSQSRSMGSRPNSLDGRRFVTARIRADDG